MESKLHHSKRWNTVREYCEQSLHICSVLTTWFLSRLSLGEGLGAWALGWGSLSLTGSGSGSM